MSAEDIKNMMKNGTVNMDDLIKGMNGTFNNVANITTESENGEVKKEEVTEEKKEENKEETTEEKKEENPEL